MATPTHSPVLFPPFVAQHSVLFHEEEAGRLAESFPGVPLPSSLASAVPKRQVEFVAGRYCAREALRRCASSAAGEPIGIGQNREPLWPAGIIGAITHTRGFASAAVAKTEHALAIGLDSEQWMDEPLANRVIHQIAGGEEVNAVMQATGLAFARALTLVFSAKETLFKCLFPEVRRYFGFEDAAVISAHSADATYEIKLRANLTPSLPAGRVFVGRFAFDENRIHTAMAVTP